MVHILCWEGVSNVPEKLVIDRPMNVTPLLKNLKIVGCTHSSN
jgi:hypothetical protein